MTIPHTLMDAPSAFRRAYWPVAIVLALLLGVLWLMGYGPGGRACAVAPVVGADVAVVPAVPGAVAAPAVPPVPASVSATASVAVSSAVAAAAPAEVPAAPGVTSAPTEPPALANAALPPNATIYFATARADISAPGRAMLEPVIAHLTAQPGAKVQVSGFHDPRGNKASNEALALERARGVRALLEAKGIGRERVLMTKPVETAGTGPREAARRVELRVLP